MDAEAFMRGHAEKASSGRVPEILGDLTPEAMQQIMAMMGEMPNPATGYSMKTVSNNDGTAVFDVTYTGDGGKAFTIRDHVGQIDGAWRIVKIEKPA